MLTIISEIEQAFTESQADLSAGRFVVESVDQHLARIKVDLAQVSHYISISGQGNA